MSIVSEILGICLSQLDNPPRDIISEGEMLLYVFKALSLNTQKLDAVGLSDRLFFPVTPSAREFDLSSRLQGSEASYVQRLIDPARSVYEPVEIVNVDQLDEYEQAGKFAVAFFGIQPTTRARLSWIPAEIQYSTLRVWYTPANSYPTTQQDAVQMPPNFDYMLADQAIMLALPVMIKRAGKLGDTSFLDFIRTWADVASKFMREFEEQFDLHRMATKDSSAGQNLSFRAARQQGSRDPRRFGF